jgi:hypothetical protein
MGESRSQTDQPSAAPASLVILVHLVYLVSLVYLVHLVSWFSDQTTQ